MSKIKMRKKTHKNKSNLCHGVQSRMVRVRMLKFKSERFDLTSYVCVCVWHVAISITQKKKKLQEEKKVKTDFLCN